MYKRARKFNKRYIEEGRVSLRYGDFLQFALPNNHYDKIFCLNVIYFWNELGAPFERVYSLLRENGFFDIYMADRKFLAEQKTPDSVFNKYSVDEVMEALKSVGFNKLDHIKNNGHFIFAQK
ncbi:MAG TPA: class I SAM-dependent methyltransferase [Flavisolibacter sp.]